MMNRDCFAWEGLKSGVKMAQSMSAFPEMDEIEREIEQLAHDIIADPRRAEAMRRNCPQLLQEVEARVPDAGAPPAATALTDPTALARALREMGDEDFSAVEEVVAGERARRSAKRA